MLHKKIKIKIFSNFFNYFKILNINENQIFFVNILSILSLIQNNFINTIYFEFVKIIKQI